MSMFCFQCQEAAKKFANALGSIEKDRMKFIESQCKIIVAKGDDDQKKRAEEIMTFYQKYLPTFSGWMGIGKKPKADDSTPPKA